MANTTNYNWETPDDTDLVKDGAAAIRTLGSSIDTTTKALNPSTTLGDIEYRSATANTNTRLGIGSTGQVLTVAGGVPTWATSDDANAIQNAIVDAKGDIVAASAADTPARLAVGTDNQRLVAASGEATGLKYVSDTQNTVIDAEGDLLIGDADNALQRLAIGSNAQVLTVDTTVDGKIKWATPAGASGALTKIASASFSAQSSVAVDDVFSATYKMYYVLWFVEGSSAGADLELQYRYAGPNTQAANYYGSGFSYDRGNSISTWGYSATNQAVIYDTLSSGAGFESSGDITFANVGNSSQNPTYFGKGFGQSSQEIISYTGYCDTARTYTGFLLKPSTGTITGYYRVYGLEN